MIKPLHFFWLAAACIASACGRDSGIEDAVVSSDDTRLAFADLRLTFTLENPAKGYLVQPQIDSVHLRVNGKDRGTFASQPIDTAGLTDNIDGSFAYSRRKAAYLVLAPYQSPPIQAQTAGQVAEYLKQRVVLEPGQHICEVQWILLRDGNTKRRIKPSAYKDFQVLPNTVASFTGEIPIIFKP